MIKALIDAGEALPDWLLQSEGEPPDDIYATEGTSKRYPEGWAEEFMSDEEKKAYRAKKAKKKKPVKKAKGGMAEKTDVEKFISFQNQIEEELSKATTPEEREIIQRNGQQILDSFSNETKLEAYRQRAREAGYQLEKSIKLYGNAKGGIVKKKPVKKAKGGMVTKWESKWG